MGHLGTPATTVDNLWIYALIGIVGGLFLFYRGFRMLQRKRLILSTPTSKIRSASMGLVEVSGLAVGPYTILAPVTRKPCFYYRTLAWELRRSSKSEEWKQVADESLHVPFYLDDNTGKLLVNPQGADMDLHRDFHEQYSNSIFAGKEAPDTVRAFLRRHGVSGDHKVRIDEYCIKPKNALFILGTLAENPGLSVSSKPIPTLHGTAVRFSLNLPGTTKDLAFSFGVKTPTELPASTGIMFRQQVIRLTPDKTPASTAGMSQQAKVAAALTKAGITNPAAWAAAGISDPTAAMSIADSSSATAAAPAVEVSEPFDLHPNVVLMRGQNDPSLLISWRSEREVVSSLNWKATACIWGGPALILLSVYVLLLKMGLI